MIVTPGLKASVTNYSLFFATDEISIVTFFDSQAAALPRNI
jgi:hypothetical protein